MVTCRVGRPIMYAAAAPMATDGGEPVRTRAYELAWAIPSFRRNSRLMTAIIGALMILDSVIRIAVVYHYPAATMITFVRPNSRVVDSLMDESANVVGAPTQDIATH